MVTVVVFEFCVMRCQPLRRALCSPQIKITELHMSKNLRKTAAYTALVLVLGCIAFYASMEDYQKENFSKLVSQTFSG